MSVSARWTPWPQDPYVGTRWGTAPHGPYRGRHRRPGPLRRTARALAFGGGAGRAGRPPLPAAKGSQCTT
jgi:hypothetical protein